ncbi:hypothetical protein DL96DRAFT_1606098, partial [Flagelloscypha sp. PMI_526]
MRYTFSVIPGLTSMSIPIHTLIFFLLFFFRCIRNRWLTLVSLDSAFDFMVVLDLILQIS